MSEEAEVWKTVPGTRGHIEASSLGRVRRVRRGSIGAERKVSPPHVYTQQEDRYGYRTVCLSLDGRWRPYGVHALVCAAFHGPKKPGDQAAHGDGTRSNNTPGNLRWATAKEQSADKLAHGRQMAGETCHLAKLTNDQVRIIRSMHPDQSFAAIAREFGVTPENISNIIKRKTWKNV